MKKATRLLPWAAVVIATVGVGCVHGRPEPVGAPPVEAPPPAAPAARKPAPAQAAARPRRRPPTPAPAPAPVPEPPAPQPESLSQDWQEAHAAGHQALVEEQLEEAEALFLSAVAQAESEEGTELLLSEALQDLGRLYVTQARWSDAEAVAGRALLILWTVLGPDHPDTMLLMENYAGVLRALGRVAEADALEENTRILRSVAEESGAPIPAP